MGYATKAGIAEIHRIFEQRREWLEKLERTCDFQFARIARSKLSSMKFAVPGRNTVVKSEK